MAGKCSRASTALTIVATVLAAASGFSWEMYSDTAIRFARAARSQLTRTSRQASDRLLHFLVGSEVACVGFGQALLDFGDLPLVDRDEFLDRLSRDERAAAVQRFRQTVKLILELGVQTEGENRRFRHYVYIVHRLYSSWTQPELVPTIALVGSYFLMARLM
jgi:hypothetical protein